MERMPDGNTAALNIKEREDHKRDIEFARLEKWAERRQREMLDHVDADVVRLAMETVSDNDLEELSEDIGNGPMRDLAHAGLVMREVLERFCLAQAWEEISGEVGPCE